MSILGLIVTLIIFGLIAFVLWWGWTKIGPKIPDPFNTIIMVLGVLLIVVFLINFLLGIGGVTFNGGPLFHWRS
jgi:hypothetical protein